MRKLFAPPPLFDKYPLQGAKSQDFSDFKRLDELMKNKAHLNESGLEEIRLILLSPQTKKISLFFELRAPKNTWVAEPPLSENKRYYSTATILNTDRKNNKISTEGCFHVRIRNNK